ncbi:MAG: glycogen synthase [Chlamydiales bacterium]|nr:glycogen synthase [Chlamydiales bacterium]
MRIVHIASEFAPLAKVGGMSDVLLGLARATVEAGHDVTVILPKYSSIDTPCEKLQDFAYTYDGNVCRNTIFLAQYESIPLLLFETHTPHKFFCRPNIYGEKDDADRYAYFSKLVASYLNTRTPPDAIHVHDWHTALVAHLYKKCRSILTIHNLAYPGDCGFDTLQKVGLSKEQAEPFKFNDYYSLLQAGIVSADHITTVSPTYAKEILTPELGGRFFPLLNETREKLSGVLNGIDYTYWNPENDPHLPFHYNAHNLEGKKLTQQEVRKRFKLREKNAPIVGAVARLVPQKGPKLIEAALKKCVAEGGQFLLVGSASDPETEHQFKALKEHYEKSRDVHIELSYNEALAHLVFAASDLLIVPSLFEPCGLTQMIAMRYGTVPLVRSTGGLADTVTEQNGFTFLPPTPEAVEATLLSAFSCWKQTPEKWSALVAKGMREDFSWKKPSERYLELYQLHCTF